MQAGDQVVVRRVTVRAVDMPLDMDRAVATARPAVMARRVAMDHRAAMVPLVDTRTM